LGKSGQEQEAKEPAMNENKEFEPFLSTRPKEKIHTIPRCKDCGLPRTLPLLFRWRDEGVITLRWFATEFRFVFLYQELLDLVLSYLEDTFGKEKVDQLTREAEKGSASEYIAMIVLGDKWWLKPVSLLIRYTKLVNLLLELSSSLFGYGAIQVIEHGVPYAVAYIRNPYRLSMFRADGEGVYEVTKERRMEMQVVEISAEESVYYFVGKTSDKGRIPNLFHLYRIQPAPIQGATTPLDLPRCPRCKLPQPLSNYVWDERMGIVLNKLSGRRMILWPDYALQELLKTFEEALGEKARQIIFDITKQFWTDLILSKGVGLAKEEQLAFLEASAQRRYEIILNQIAYQGLGRATKVEIEESPYRVKVELINPTTPTIVSGILAGIFEALEEREVEVEMEERETSVTYSLTEKTKADQKQRLRGVS
jgi:hypothetical protein